MQRADEQIERQVLINVSALSEARFQEKSVRERGALARVR
jgi:hypothetical protein